MVTPCVSLANRMIIFRWTSIILNNKSVNVVVAKQSTTNSPYDWLGSMVNIGQTLAITAICLQTHCSHQWKKRRSWIFWVLPFTYCLQLEMDDHQFLGTMLSTGKEQHFLVYPYPVFQQFVQNQNAQYTAAITIPPLIHAGWLYNGSSPMELQTCCKSSDKNK